MNTKAEINEAGQVAHKSVYSALVRAQANMTRALKDVPNGAFKTKYADLANVQDACFPALNAEGIAVIQPTGEDEAGRFVETVFYHADTDTQIKCRVPLIVGKNDMQGYGSAVTYARRYGLMSLAGIAPEDDDGNAAADAAPAKVDAEKSPSKNEEARKMYTMAQTQMRENKTLADLESWWKDPDMKAILKKLPDDWYETLKKEVLAMIDDFKKPDDSPFSEAAE
jgi:hypothetical protein